MKITIRVLYLFMALIMGGVLSAQTIKAGFTEVADGRYNLGNKTAKLHLFEDEMQFDKKASLLFEEYKKSRKKQRVWNWTALGMATTGIVAGILVANKEKGYEFDGFYKLAGAFVAVAGISAGLLTVVISNIIIGSAKKRQKKALFEYVSDNWPGKAHSLNFGMKNAGIGFTYTF